MAKEVVTYEEFFWWGSLDRYAPEGGNDGSASQYGRGLGVGGLCDKPSCSLYWIGSITPRGGVSESERTEIG